MRESAGYSLLRFVIIMLPEQDKLCFEYIGAMGNIACGSSSQGNLLRLFHLA
jgi:hypothetical protein